MKYILLTFTFLFLLSPLFGQSEESIQFETFYQEAKTDNSGDATKQELKPEQEKLPETEPDTEPGPLSDPDPSPLTITESEVLLDPTADAEPEPVAGPQPEQTPVEEPLIVTDTEAESEKDSGKSESSPQQSGNESEAAPEEKRHGALFYRQQNGAWGWYEYGDEDKDGKYVGDIVNMKPNGYGTFVYGKGKWEGDKYEGQWNDGEYHGQGIFISESGQKFKGEWQHSVPWNITGYDKFGKIIKKYRNGVQVFVRKKTVSAKKSVVKKRTRGILYREVPRSKWERGGKKWMSNGDEKIHGKYEGDILDGLPDGYGTYTWYNVEKYEGEFKRGFFHGQGKFTYLSGLTVEGEFRKQREWNTMRVEENGEASGKYVNGRYYPLKP